MKRFISILVLSAILTSAAGQNYLIKDPTWVMRIKKDPSLAPLSFGVKKTQAQITKDRELVTKLVRKYGGKARAYKKQLIDGWNYITIGKIDSAILSFNLAYLIDKENLETFFAVSTIINYTDGAVRAEMADHYHLMEKLDDPWGMIAFLGNPEFVDGVKAIHKEFPVPGALSGILAANKEPYVIDSGRFVMVKIRWGREEGQYRMGRPYGQWTDYYEEDGNSVMRHYTIVDGEEFGKITAFHRNGKLSSIFYKNRTGDINGEFEIYDYNGQLVRIEYWHNNVRGKDVKVIKEWEEDGTAARVENGQFKEYIWKDGKKTPKQ